MADEAQVVDGVRLLEELTARIKALEKDLEAADEANAMLCGELEDAHDARDTWRAEAQDRRAEVARLQTETDYLRAKLCHAATEPLRIPG